MNSKTQQFLDSLDMQDLDFGHKFRELKKFAVNTELILQKVHRMYKIAIEDAMSYGPSEQDSEYVALDKVMDEYFKE